MYGELRFLSAKEMYDITQQSLKQLHNQWLKSIQQGILNAAKNGYTSYTFDCRGKNSFEELCNIYKPHGYNVILFYTFKGNPRVTISWTKE